MSCPVSIPWPTSKVWRKFDDLFWRKFKAGLVFDIETPVHRVGRQRIPKGMWHIIFDTTRIKVHEVSDTEVVYEVLGRLSYSGKEEAGTGELKRCSRAQWKSMALYCLENDHCTFRWNPK